MKRPGLSLTRLLVLGALGCSSSAGGDAPSTSECSDACAKIAAADCGDIGAECVDRCVRQDADGECSAELQTYVDCYWRAEAYVCDDQRGTVAPSCEDELEAAETCSDGSDADGGSSPGGAGNVGGAGAGS